MCHCLRHVSSSPGRQVPCSPPQSTPTGSRPLRRPAGCVLGRRCHLAGNLPRSSSPSPQGAGYCSSAPTTHTQESRSGCGNPSGLSADWGLHHLTERTLPVRTPASQQAFTPAAEMGRKSPQRVRTLPRGWSFSRTAYCSATPPLTRQTHSQGLWACSPLARETQNVARLSESTFWASTALRVGPCSTPDCWVTPALIPLRPSSRYRDSLRPGDEMRAEMHPVSTRPRWLTRAGLGAHGSPD